MRKVILQDFVSLDGFAAGFNRERHRDLGQHQARVVCPVVLGAGRTVFGGQPAKMKLQKTQSFGQGAVLLAYT